MKESNFISPTAASPVAHRPYDFSFACLSAGTTSQIDGSLSACRTGGVGVVDLISNIDPPQKPLGEQHLRALLASCAPGAACGGRICATPLLHLPELLSLLA